MKRIVCIAMLVLLLLPGVAVAHGGGTPVLTRAEAGPFWLYVFTEPGAPQAGSEYHVTVAVTQPQAGSSEGSDAETAVEDASVTVRFVPAAGEAIVATAVPSTAGPGYYEADTRLPNGGAWTVQIEVASPLGAGSAEYNVEAAAAPGGMAWSWVGAGIVLALAVIGLLLYGFARRSKAQPAGAVDATTGIGKQA